MIWGIGSKIKKNLLQYEAFCSEDELDRLRTLFKDKVIGVSHSSFGISEKLATDVNYPVLHFLVEQDVVDGKELIDFVDTLNHTAYVHYRNTIFTDIGKDAQKRLETFFDSKPGLMTILLHQFFSTEQFHILLISDKHCHTETLIEILVSLHPHAKIVSAEDSFELGPIIPSSRKPTMKPGLLQDYADGLIGLSHIEKLSKAQQSRLTEAMDTGFVHRKVNGVTFKPPSNVSILGFTQPNTSVFVGKHVGLFRQQLPVSLDLMEHFHMAVCVKCKTEGCLAPLSFSETDLGFVQEYISYAATKPVVFPRQFDTHVADWHKLVHKKRDKYIPPITKNLAIAVIRLSVAHARMHLRDEVSLGDLKFAMDILQDSLFLLTY